MEGRIAFVDVSPRKERRPTTTTTTIASSTATTITTSTRENGAKRRKTLHVDIPTKYIGHTRSIGDEDPVLPLVLDDGDEDDNYVDGEDGAVGVGEEVTEGDVEDVNVNVPLETTTTTTTARGRSRVRKNGSLVRLG